jgi:uncharacterized membrane protein HdeD (DUF308 family)
MLLEALARNWWVFLIRGVLAILFGIVAWIWPGLTVTVLVVLFGAYALVDGIFAIIAAFTSGEGGRWLPLLLLGLVGIAIGIMTFVWPDITAVALITIIGVWAIIIGIMQIVAAIQLRQRIEGEWALGLAGLAAIVFGAIVVIFPGSGAIALVWLIGIYVIFFGILLVALAFRLRSLRSDAGPAVRA